MGQHGTGKESAMSENEQEWETEEVEVSKPVTPVISVRFPNGVAERIFAEAERRGVRTSAVVREAVEAYLDDPTARPATVDLTISSPDAAVTLYQGRSRAARTGSAPATLVSSNRS
jgi:hypothetical protein